jgi:5,10-methylene-tetrahydrofolate dehydrogenase/methenyl tetrahydrofolate cyclohydrolase
MRDVTIGRGQLFKSKTNLQASKNNVKLKLKIAYTNDKKSQCVYANGKQKRYKFLHCLMPETNQ